MLTMKAKYALRALCALAQADPQRLQARRLAGVARVPEKFLEAILVDLRKAGLVDSARGIVGGHRLAQPASAIQVGDVIRVIDGPLAPIRCASVTAYLPCADCPDPDRCALRGLMSDVRDAISGVLDRRSLAEFAGTPAPAAIGRDG
jgi:Rrf2 family protein